MKTDFINEFGDFPIMDNTSTSSRVFEKFKRHIQKAKRDAAAGGDRELFLHLWALTMVYKECDYSFHDTDMPEEGQKQLSALANLWKKVLALPAQALDVDEVSKQAVMSLLQVWKTELAEHCHPYTFNFRPAQARETGAAAPTPANGPGSNGSAHTPAPGGDPSTHTSTSGSSGAARTSASGGNGALGGVAPSILNFFAPAPAPATPERAGGAGRSGTPATTSKRPTPGGSVEENTKAAKVARTEGGGAVGELQGYLAGLPSNLKDPTLDAAVQLRLSSGSRRRVLILSGNATLYKLNQFIAEVFAVAKSDFTSNAQKGSTGEGTYFSVSRPQAPGQCAEAWVCAKQVAKGRPYIDHKTVKVGHLFRGSSDGTQLVREAGEEAMSVRFVHPLLPAPVDVTLDGVMPNKLEQSGSIFEMRHKNNPALPRLVGWSTDFSETKAKSLNVKMAEGRKGREGCLWSPSKAELKEYSIQPLFEEDGSDWATKRLNAAIANSGGLAQLRRL